MSRILKVSQNRFKFAGTTDKRAITKQKISIWKATREDIAKINLSDLKLKVIGYSNKQIGLGDLWRVPCSTFVRVGRNDRDLKPFSKKKGIT